MSRAVLDASAILALVLGEQRAEKLTLDILATSIISSVNLAEVQTKLVNSGHDPDKAWEDAQVWVSEAVPYTPEHARIAGDLVLKTRSLGLSLADRSCLALALSLDLPVYTTELIWRDLDVGVKIHILR